jgi:hypothetical protein
MKKSLRSTELLRTRQGMILMSSLTLLSILVVVSLGASVMLQNDFRILGNLRGATEAFYISAAGLEWAKSEIARAASFPPSPSNQSKSFSGGQFAVLFQSSSIVDPLAARVIVHSTGVRDGAESLLQAQLTKSYDLADAGLVIRGNGAGVSMTADAIFVSGNDHDPSTGNPSGAKSRSSVSVTDDTLRALVEHALGTPPRQGVLEESAHTPAIANSDYLPASLISQLANDFCVSAAASVHPILNGTNLTIENQTWGTAAAPQLRCIEGLSASGDTVTMAGNVAGVGILVVKNADLVLSGTFRWEGLVLVTGVDVSLKTTGIGTRELLGAAIVSETGIPGAERNIVDFEGAIRILFSRKALSRLSNFVPTSTANIAYESLPSVILQDYWRIATP